MKASYKKLLIIVVCAVCAVCAHGADLVLRSPAFLVTMDKRTGRFSLKTTGGNPLEERDSGIDILDTSSSPATTHASVRYGGHVYLFGGMDGVGESMISNKQLIYRWQMNDLAIVQSISLAAGTEPSCRIAYTLSAVRPLTNIGLRLALDTSVSNAFIGVVSETTRIQLHTNCRALASWYSVDSPSAPQICLRYEALGDGLSHTIFSFWRSFEQSYDAESPASSAVQWAFTPNDDRGIGIYWNGDVRPAPADLSCTIYAGSTRTDSNFIMRTASALPPAVQTTSNIIAEIETATNITFIFPDVNFDAGSAILRRESYSFLDAIGEALKRYPGRKFAVNGHADARGTEAFNRKLSEERARAVYNYLIYKFKIDESLCTVNGFGTAFPVADNTTLDGQARNRRVEIVVEK